MYLDVALKDNIFTLLAISVELENKEMESTI
jgi:hypothetical protein